MPEGHTVHRLARDHSQEFVGQRMIVTSPQGRFAEEAEELSGRYLLDVEAIGKHLIYQWGQRRKTTARRPSPTKIMHVHLGLYGKFRLHGNPAPEPRGAVRVRMIGKQKSFDLNGPNCCELLTPQQFAALQQRLGQDPLREDGLGNIYRAEVLWLLKIHPERKGTDVSREEFDTIWELSVKLLRIGLKYDRIITVSREMVDKPLSRLSRQERLLIYKKSRCRTCNRKVRWWEVGSRKMYACEKCQT